MHARAHHSGDVSMRRRGKKILRPLSVLHNYKCSKALTTVRRRTTIAFFGSMPIRNIRSYSPSMTDFFSNFPAGIRTLETRNETFFLVVQGVGQWRKFSNGSAKLHICCRRCSTYFVAIDHKKIAIDDGSFCHVSEKCFSFTSPRNSACSRPGGSR